MLIRCVSPPRKETLLQMVTVTPHRIGPYENCFSPNSILFFHKFIFFRFNFLQSSFTFYPNFTIRKCVQHGFPLIFHMDFRPQVTLALIYIFPIDMMLTEFARQRIKWLTEVVLKLLCSVF